MDQLQDRKKQLELRIAMNKRMSGLLKDELTELNKELLVCNSEILKERDRVNDSGFVKYKLVPGFVEAFMRCGGVTKARGVTWVNSYIGSCPADSIYIGGLMLEPIDYICRTDGGVIFSCPKVSFELMFRSAGCLEHLYYNKMTRVKATIYTEDDPKVCVNSVPLQVGDYMCIGDNGTVFACPKEAFEAMYVVERD